MSKLLADLDRLITAEEKVEEMLANNEALQNRSKPSTGQRRNDRPPGRLQSCIYCNSPEHSSQACTKVASIKERTQLLLKYKRCLNCTRSNHLLKECISKGCNMCEGKKHHSSICPKRQNKESPTQQRNNITGPAHTTKRTKQDTGRSTQRQNYTASSESSDPQIGKTDQNKEEGSTSTFYISNTEPRRTTSKVLLLTGMAKVCDTKSGEMKEVEILLDTGADRSFITGKLANKLNLPNIDSVDLSVYTFGNKAPRHQKCEVCELQLWDTQGNIHNLSLCITDVITEKGKQARLTSEDRKYLQQQGITLTKSKKTLTNPQVLLGCDTLWPLLNCAGTLHVLPSGLFAIPSKLGYLLSGKQELCRRKRITDTKVNDSGEKTTIAQLNAQEAAELERWDRY
ncbi:unnamed protein product [Haemonchus placei]|uniref:Peptidase A2 domain-containing protein n=1 Tax=Haemonchus placei TaxID=6290 RepID=A0A0N4VRY5_HAEPC|nr:unnamed protein product [Haemonchus placei]